MRYVIAVSGGVDSVVLLDVLTAKDRRSEIEGWGLDSLWSVISDPRSHLIVAHFDHGIRPDSADDARFVEGLAEQYGLRFIAKRAELGLGTSEDRARIERYNFLRQCCKEENAQLVTAHHQDDVVETAIINLIRGTGWRGLAPMADQASRSKTKIPDGRQVFRPLLSVSKPEILAYAKKHNLQWREDSTNEDEVYLRNYVRKTLLPQMLKKDSEAMTTLIDLIQSTTSIKEEIATELQRMMTDPTLVVDYNSSEAFASLSRYPLIMYPPEVSSELIYTILTRADPSWHPSSVQIQRALHFIKTGFAGKELIISKHLKLVLKTDSVQFKKY